jgi:hypothetical protein
MRCRKNYRDLTPVERDRLVQALHHVKAAGIVDQYAAEHETHFSHGIHTSSHFLPWHRDFIRRFEDALRTYHPAVTLPYWNSVVDRSTSDPLWDNAFLGQFDAAWNLDRALGSDTLPTSGQMDAALNQSTYDAFWPDLESNVHNAPHRWVEGEMGQRDSPHDPVFYLHHCWIDLLWAQWQLRNPGAAFVSSGAGLGLNDAMMGVTTTPADVIDHRTINVYDYPPGFQQDAPIVTLDTPVVNFLDVPAGETRMVAAVFDLDACATLHFTVLNGPTVTSGPAGTAFGVYASPVAADPHLDAKGRLWLSYTGTAADDVATGTVRIGCDETGQPFDIVLTANTIARQTAALVMVLDQSNSMTFDSGLGAGIKRADVLKFSAPTAVVVLEDENAMAVCSFDHDAHPGIGITPAAGVGKLTINAAIQSYAPNPNGWTSIGEGVVFAKGLVQPVTGYDVKALVVLTDGQENHGPHTRRSLADVADLVTAMNGRVFAIGLGRADVLNPAALQALCSGNNGYMLMTGDLTPDASFRLAKYYQQIFAGVTNNEIVLDPEGFVGPAAEVRIPFWLAETDILAKTILLTPAPWLINFRLETPDGDIIDPGVAAAHPMVAFDAGERVSLYRVGLPTPLGSNTAHAGRWYARLAIDKARFKKYLGSLDNNPALSASTAAHGVRYCLSVHAYSNLRMRATLSQSGNEPGATLTLRATLAEYGVPLPYRASCRAELVRPDNSQAILALSEVQPGIFESATPANLPGIYRVRIVAEGKTLRARPFTREQTLTGAVWRGGDDPPRPPGSDPTLDPDRLCNLIACLLKNKGLVALLEKHGVSPDELRRCFGAYCRKASPAEPARAAATLESRLRDIVGDEALLRAVLDAVKTGSG